MARRLTILALLLVASLGAACGGGEERAAEEAIERAAQEQGQDVDVGIGDTASIPDDFPEEFPLPSGTAPVYSLSAQGSFSIWFGGGGDDAEMRSFYEAELPDRGWTVDQDFSVSGEDGDVTVLGISGHGYTGGVYFGRGGPAQAFDEEFSFFITLVPEGS